MRKRINNYNKVLQGLLDEEKEEIKQNEKKNK